MIHTDALTRTYGRGPRAVTALDGVSLDMGPGVWGVVGPNGAGKTTFLALILGFLRPTGGTVEVDGRPPRRYLRRHGAAYLPERFRLPPEWPVRAALEALARLEGEPNGEGGGGADAAARADAAIERLGLGEHAHRPVGALSRGLNQRVGLAQALLSDRRLVVLDEPTEGLDPIWRVRFRELVHGLRDDGRTVLLASHDLAEVERLADRVILLQDGRVRDVLEAHTPTPGPLRYRLVARAPGDAIPAAFGDSATAAPGSEGPEAAAAGGAPPPVAYTLAVADEGELAHRLAAFLKVGGTIVALTPVGDNLEARVRDRLEDA